MGDLDELREAIDRVEVYQDFQPDHQDFQPDRFDRQDSRHQL
jgi:hypothetical protein